MAGAKKKVKTIWVWSSVWFIVDLGLREWSVVSINSVNWLYKVFAKNRKIGTDEKKHFDIELKRLRLSVW